MYSEPTAEADRGRHPGFPSFNVFAGGAGSLALALCGQEAMSDWAGFTESIPWFLDRDAAVEVSAPRKSHALSPLVATLFPHLGKLLAKALVTDVTINGASYELLAWDSPQGDRLGWLCLPPSENAPRNLHDDHRILLGSFGGIVERFNEPEDTW